MIRFFQNLKALFKVRN